MKRFLVVLSVAMATMSAAPLYAANEADLKALLGREIVGKTLPMAEVQQFCEARIVRMPKVQTAAQWGAEANRLRAAMFERVIFRGEAAKWRDAKTKVEWLESLPGGPGYRMKRVRYEALPGLWIPAILYEPETYFGRAPVSLAVNGHTGAPGKSVPYKQIRCINQAKRGMIVLNVDWPGMGQLATPGFMHYRMNQIDLCGTGGIAVHYLYMKRALDLLLSLEHADAERVAVSGLSGGGWQTIFISSLDTRVTLANPVAGYSSFFTRVKNVSDLGDSEQTPCDMATVADYAHLTAMRAPRPTLLTKNSKDNCCFASGHALQPLLNAAKPIFQLYGREDALRWHVNDDPGTHNYELDNRQAFYRMLQAFFYFGDEQFSPKEIPCEKELKTFDELKVALPAKNEDFHTLATALSQALPREPQLPKDKAAVPAWQQRRRKALHAVVRAKDYQVHAIKLAEETRGGVKATFWRLQMAGDWTVPAVELVQGEPKGTTLLVSEAGRAALAADVARLLAAGQRVVAMDPFYFGESKIASRDFLYALLVGAVGERPIGLQASQVAAVARWCAAQPKGGPVKLVAKGQRSSLFALIAAALEEKAIGQVELNDALGSLKEVIEKDWSVDQKPEMFCFGLLEAFDVKQIAALVAPRPLTLEKSSPRAQSELADLPGWYSAVGGQVQVRK